MNKSSKNNHTYHPWLAVNDDDTFILFPGWCEKPQKNNGTWITFYGRTVSHGLPIPIECLATNLQDWTSDDPPIRI